MPLYQGESLFYGEINILDGKIVIIGAGPAGLACAMELARAGSKATIIEKDSQVGGLAKTLTFREGKHLFRTDLGPHRFFSKNQYLYDFIENLLHEEWRPVARRTRQFIDGKFYDYPINAIQVFKNIGLIKSIQIVMDYVYSKVRYNLFRRKIETFEDYIVSHFGRTLADFSMINYTEKIWGIPVGTIHPDWARQRISGLNLISVLKSAFFINRNAKTPKSLVDQFYYPQFGTGLIYERIAKHLQKIGSTIHTNGYPTKIHHTHHRVTELELLIDGSKRMIQPDFLVESIPITHFLDLLEPKPPQQVVDAANALRWRSQSNLFITLDRPHAIPDNWIYFPNKEIPFGRISEMKNFSEYMSPKDKTSLLVEFFAFEDDNIWHMSKDELFELALPYFEELGFFKREDVRKYYLIKQKYVYPVYDIHYQDHLKPIRAYLDRFENLLYIGRPGRFKYTNQDHSLEMGMVACRSILDRKKYDLEKVGADEIYFEKGPVYEKRV